MPEKDCEDVALGAVVVHVGVAKEPVDVAKGPRDVGKESRDGFKPLKTILEAILAVNHKNRVRFRLLAQVSLLTD